MNVKIIYYVFFFLSRLHCIINNLFEKILPQQKNGIHPFGSYAAFLAGTGLAFQYRFAEA
jgi:hypothetical protein